MKTKYDWLKENPSELKIANSKLASIELVMNDYYNGSYSTIEELAGEISFILQDSLEDRPNE